MKSKLSLIVILLLAFILVGCRSSQPEAVPAPSQNQPAGGAVNPGPSNAGQGPGQLPGGGGPNGIGQLMTVIAEETGLDANTLREQTAAGQTLAEVIEANGGDVEAIQAKLVETLQASMTNLSQDEIEQQVSNMLNGTLPQPNGGLGQNPFFGMMDIIAEETGLDADTLREQTAAGQTLAEVIEANGGDVEAVKTRLIDAMSTTTDLTAEEIEQQVSNMLNGTLPGGFGGPPPEGAFGGPPPTGGQ